MTKTTPLIFFLGLTNGIGFVLYFFRYTIFPNVNFVEHLDGLGSAIASYATAMMALVFALIVILTSLDNNNIRKFKAYGYLKSTYFFILSVLLNLALLCF
ncbi:hypothetical protein [Pantoea ananatis]|uniref:hypothetical protein n=1 Tax=Pantoea ananas TaxID=553 RepID=UPI001B310008|nr:hypothetical protein [Pantoea ananatis]